MNHNFCPKCGKPVSNGDEFCSNCGAKLNNDNSVATNQVNAPVPSQNLSEPKYQEMSDGSIKFTPEFDKLRKKYIALKLVVGLLVIVVSLMLIYLPFYLEGGIPKDNNYFFAKLTGGYTGGEFNVNPAVSGNAVFSLLFALIEAVEGIVFIIQGLCALASKNKTYKMVMPKNPNGYSIPITRKIVFRSINSAIRFALAPVFLFLIMWIANAITFKITNSNFMELDNVFNVASYVIYAVIASITGVFSYLLKVTVKKLGNEANMIEKSRK